MRECRRPFTFTPIFLLSLPNAMLPNPSTSSDAITTPPHKKARIDNTTVSMPVDDDNAGLYIATLTVINIDQFTTALRLVMTQLTSSSVLTMQIIEGTPVTFSGLRCVCLDPSKVSLVKCEIGMDVVIHDKTDRPPSITIRVQDFLHKLRGIERGSSLQLFIPQSGEMLTGSAVKGSCKRTFSLPLQDSEVDVRELEELSCAFDVTITVTASSCTSILTQAKTYESYISFMLQQAREEPGARFLTLNFSDDVAGSCSETFYSVMESKGGTVHRVPESISVEEALSRYTLRTSVGMTKYPAHKVCPFVSRIPQGEGVAFRFNTGGSNSPQPLFMKYSDGANSVEVCIAPHIDGTA